MDTFDKMITKELAEHADVKLIDFTGNSAFGSYLEALPGKNSVYGEDRCELGDS